MTTILDIEFPSSDSEDLDWTPEPRKKRRRLLGSNSGPGSHGERRFIQILLELLSLKRVNDYSTWIEVGSCLKNLSVHYFDLWLVWSQKSDKFPGQDECAQVWSQFPENGLFGLASLLKWAGEDSPEKYEYFVKNQTDAWYRHQDKKNRKDASSSSSDLSTSLGSEDSSRSSDSGSDDSGSDDSGSNESSISSGSGDEELPPNILVTE